MNAIEGCESGYLPNGQISNLLESIKLNTGVQIINNVEDCDQRVFDILQAYKKILEAFPQKLLNEIGLNKIAIFDRSNRNIAGLANPINISTDIEIDISACNYEICVAASVLLHEISHLLEERIKIIGRFNLLKKSEKASWKKLSAEMGGYSGEKWQTAQQNMLGFFWNLPINHKDVQNTSLKQRYGMHSYREDVACALGMILFHIMYSATDNSGYYISSSDEIDPLLRQDVFTVLCNTSIFTKEKVLVKKLNILLKALHRKLSSYGEEELSEPFKKFLTDYEKYEP